MGGGRLGEGLRPELQDQHTYDHYDYPDYLHGFHSLSKNYIGQDCRGSRLSHTESVGVAGFDVTERLDVKRICSKGQALISDEAFFKVI